MTTDHATRATEAYLGQVSRAAERAGLSETERSELIEQLAEHIEEARLSATGEPALAVLDAIDRLGDPDEVAAAARDEASPHVAFAERCAVREPYGAPAAAGPPAPPAAQQGRFFEYLAIIGLGIGWLTGGLLSLIGIAALLGSSQWSRGDKLVGLCGPLMGVLALLLILMHGAAATSTLAVVLTIPMCAISAIFLWFRLPRRA